MRLSATDGGDAERANCYVSEVHGEIEVAGATTARIHLLEQTVSTRNTEFVTVQSPPRHQQDPATSPSVPAPSRTAPLTEILRIDVNQSVDAVGSVPTAMTSQLKTRAKKKAPVSSSHPVSTFNSGESRANRLPCGTRFLEYGMVVALSCDDRSGIVAADGYASKDVRLEKLNYGVDLDEPPPKLGLGGHEECKLFEEGGFRLTSCPYRNCLFEVVPKMTYDTKHAVEALKAEINKRRDTQGGTREQNRRLRDLSSKSETELRLNATMYERLKGAQVIYGQLIFTSENDAQSFSLYVPSKIFSDATSFGVVGATTRASHWRAVFYDKPQNTSSTSIRGSGFRAGSCVQLFHLETVSWLRLGMSEQNEAAGFRQVSLQFREDRDVEVESVQECSAESTWEVERTNVYEGGAISWNDSITFRHVTTGKYLAVSPRAVLQPGNTRSHATIRTQTEMDYHVVAQDLPQSFCFIPTAVADDGDQIENGDIGLILHNKGRGFLHSVCTHDPAGTDMSLLSETSTNVSSHSGSNCTVGSLPGVRDEDAFKIIAVAQSEMEDTLLLVSYKQILKTFISQFQLPTVPSQDNAHIVKDKSLLCHLDCDDTILYFRKVEQVLEELISFCVDGEKISTGFLRIRQKLFGVHRYIDLLVEMIKAPFQRYGGPFSVQKVQSYSSDYVKVANQLDGEGEVHLNGSMGAPTGTQLSITSKNLSDRLSHDLDTPAPARVSGLQPLYSQETSGWKRPSAAFNSSQEKHAAAMQSLNRIISSVNLLFVHIFSSNKANELHMVNIGMPILVELLGDGLKTSFPLSFLLRENRNLAESITAYTRITGSLFDLIKSRGRSIEYLQLLIALCTCRGRGVQNTQEAICEMLFNPEQGYRDYVVVPIRPSDSGFEIYVVNQNAAPNVPYPQLDTTKEITADDGFGKWVTLAKFYEDVYIRGEERPLGQYSYGLLRLYVSLCLDRNYLCIDCIQTAFPRENLLASVMDKALSRSLRAVLMDLLRVAYIDCEPQKVVACPSYTRIWADFSSKTWKVPSAFTGEENSSEDLLFLSRMKQFCSSYLDKPQGAIVVEETPKNELTLATLRVCKKMAEFGMFATEEELSYLVTRLVDLLDPRSDVLRKALPAKMQAANGHSTGQKQKNDAQVNGARHHGVPAPDGQQSLLTAMLQHVPEDYHMFRRDCAVENNGALPSIEASLQKTPCFRNSTLIDVGPAWVSSDERAKVVARQYSARSGVSSLKPRSTSKKLDEASSVKSRFETPSPRGYTAGQFVPPKSQISVSGDRMDATNRIVMEIKDEVCAILQHVDKMRVDYQLSSILSTYQARHGDSTSEPTSLCKARLGFVDAGMLAQDIAGVGRHGNPISSPIPTEDGSFASYRYSPLAKYMNAKNSLECDFSLSRLSKRNVTTVLMHTLMYEYPPLVSKAFELLLQQYTQHDQVVKAMQNLQLLVAGDTISMYNKLKDDIDTLRRLSKTAEIWMDLTLKSDFEKAETACSILKSLTDVVRYRYSARARRADENSRTGSTNPPAPGASVRIDHLAPVATSSSEKGTMTGNRDRSCQHRFVTKPPPNRKLKFLQSKYNLKRSLGNVSRFSSFHEVVVLKQPEDEYSLQTSDLRPASNNFDENLAKAIEARRLLRNLKAAQYTVGMLIGGAPFYETDGCHSEVELSSLSFNVSTESLESRLKSVHKSRQRDQIQAVYTQAMEFLCAFCANDIDSQMLLAPNVIVIAQYMGDLEVAQELLAAIYAGNAQLYNTAPAELVNLVVDRLITDGLDPRYLYFLETLVICDENPVLENQVLVLFQLIKTRTNATVLQFFDNQSATVRLFNDLFQRYANTVKYFATDKGRPTSDESGAEDNQDQLDEASMLQPELVSSRLRPPVDDQTIARDSKSLEYHVRLLNLFAACAVGSNARVQAICQQLIPIGNVLEIMWHGECTDGIQAALLRFLKDVFLFADDDRVETLDDDMLTQVFMMLAHVSEMNVTKHLKAIQIEDCNRHARFSLQKSRAKSSGSAHHLRTKLAREDPVLHVLLYSLVPTMVSFIRQFPSLFDASGGALLYAQQAQHSLGLLFVVFCASEWCLEDHVLTGIDELVRALDKSTRLRVCVNRVASSISLESLWISSLSSYRRLDLHSFHFDMTLADLLQQALDVRATHSTQLNQNASEVPHQRQMPGSILEVDHLINDTIVRMKNSDPASSSPTTDESGPNMAPSSAAKNTMISERLRVTQPQLCGIDRDRNFQPYRGGLPERLRNPSALNQKTGLPPFERVSTGARPNDLQQIPSAKHLRDRHLGSKQLESGFPAKAATYSLASHATSPRVFNLSKRSETSCTDRVGQQLIPMSLSPSQQHVWCEFDRFDYSLFAHKRVQVAMQNELNQMVHDIVSVESSFRDEYDPRVHSNSVRLTFDHVVSKLVAHAERFQDSHFTEMNLKSLDAFRRMVYASEDQEQRRRMQVKLNQLGVTKLVVQIISWRDDGALFAICIELGVALLDGLNAEVQESFYSLLLERGNTGFFKRIRSKIEISSKVIRSSHARATTLTNSVYPKLPVGNWGPTRRQESASYTGEFRSELSTNQSTNECGRSAIAAPAHQNVNDDDNIKRSSSTTISIFRFLQLLCEGHYLNMQRYLIFQPNVGASVNLVESTTSFLMETCLAVTDIDVGLITQLFETITEFCQGPCIEAQETVANFKFINTVNALMLQPVEQSDNSRSLFETRHLRPSAVMTLLSLLERRTDRVVYSQLVQELNFDSLKQNLVDVHVYYLNRYGGYAGNAELSHDLYLMMGFNIYILLQQLADVNPGAATWIPSSKSEGGLESRDRDYRSAHRFFQSHCARVEIVWDNRRSQLPTVSSHRRNYADGNPPARSQCKSPREHPDGATKRETDAVEVESRSRASQHSRNFDNGALIPFYFPIHPMCFCLTEQSKKNLMRNISLGPDKLQSFYTRAEKLVDEMEHQSHLQRHVAISWVVMQMDLFKKLSFVLAICINAVVLVFYRADGIDSVPYAAKRVTIIDDDRQLGVEHSTVIDVGLTVAGTLQLVLCCAILLCYVINSSPVIIKQGWKRRNQAEKDRISKRSSSVRSRNTSSSFKEIKSFQDTERLLRSLHVREIEHPTLFLPDFANHWTTSKTTWAGGSKVQPGDGGALDHTSERNNCSSRSLRILCEHTHAQTIRTVTISLFFLLRNPRMVYYLWQITVAILGSYVNKLYFAFHLLDIVNRYQELSNVLRSIVRPAKVLGLTVLLYLVIVYVFAIIGFYFFRADYNPSVVLTSDQIEGKASYQCQRLFQCFLVSLDQGFKSGGGLGGYLRSNTPGESLQSYARLAFDLLYNIVLIIMLLNIIFGVIVDTFASLRIADKEKTTDLQNRCFICSIDAFAFDRATERGFHDHVHLEHNMWHYLYLFVHIRKKPITEFNGLELYLATRMAKKDVLFFPSYRALSLEKASSVDTDEFLGHDSKKQVPDSTPVGRSNVNHGPLASRCAVGHSQTRFRDPSDSGISGSDDIDLSSPKGVRCDNHITHSPSRKTANAQATDSTTPAKLEKLEAAIGVLLQTQMELKDNLLQTRMEMKEQQQQAVERQRELMAMLATNSRPQHQPSAILQQPTRVGGTTLPPPSHHRPLVATADLATHRASFSSPRHQIPARCGDGSGRSARQVPTRTRSFESSFTLHLKPSVEEKESAGNEERTIHLL